MEEEFIQSRQNPRIKALAKLQDRAGRRKLGLFLVEGLRELSRAVKLAHVEEIYFCPELFMSDFHEKFVKEICEKNDGISLCRLSQAAFEKISNREGGDGIIGVVRQWGTRLEDIVLSADKPARILVADSIEKPGNLGALMRTADSLGADALIVTNSISDIYNPAAVRSSQGALFSMQIAVAEQSEASVWLKERDIRIFGAHLGAEKFIWQTDLSCSCAIVMGSEKDGLGADWEKALDQKIKIPMSGISDSMNVNVAAAVCLYEALRQSSQK